MCGERVVLGVDDRHGSVTFGRISSMCNAMADANPRKIRLTPARDQSGSG